MGAIACQFADRVIVTSDNPRSEAPEAIIDDILRGCDDSPIVESDRAAAIALVIAEAKVGDIVLIAGKGHEDYQEIDGVRACRLMMPSAPPSICSRGRQPDVCHCTTGLGRRDRRTAGG